MMDYRISNEFLTVTVSSLGGELMSVTSPDGTEFIWQGDPTFWKKRAPHLFPVVGRLTQGRCTLEGEVCQMDTHGFFRWRPMALQSQGPGRLTLSMDWDRETYEQYPRHWHGELEYALEGKTLSITFRVENQGQRPMWFAYGGHPGFQVPLEKELAFEDYRLRFQENCRPVCVGMTDACFVGGEDSPLPLEGSELPLRHALFDRDALVLRGAGREVTLYSPKGTHQVTVSFPRMSYLGLWHAPNTQAPYLCIEPWTALPSRQDVVEELSRREDFLRLAAGETYENTWSIAFD